MSWHYVLQSTRHRWAMAFCLGMISLMVFYMPTFYETIIQPKPGILLDDPVLDFFTPRNWSVTIFIILYVSLIHIIYASVRSPNTIVIGLTTYCGVNLIRMGTMYLLTLEPPPGMILLVDPIATFLVYPDSGFAKDLFFSGHVSSMMAILLVETDKRIKLVKIIGTLAVGVFLAWQHVHYTLDLIVAPFVTYGVFTLVRKIIERPGQAIRPTKGE